jgi:hypothetical protein
MMMQIAPIQASQEIRPKVRILEKTNVMIAAIATKIAVQIACIDKAFRAMDTLNIAEPEQNVKTGKNVRIGHKSKKHNSRGFLTKGKSSPKEFTTNATKEQLPDIIDTIYLTMIDFENTDDIIGPRCDSSDDDKDDDAWDQTESMENGRYR